MFPTDRQRYSADQDPPGPPMPIMPTESELASRYWDRIRLFAARRVNDAAMAEDIAQETLRRVVEALPTVACRNTEAIAGFVFQTARTCACTCPDQRTGSGRCAACTIRPMRRRSPRRARRPRQRRTANASESRAGTRCPPRIATAPRPVLRSARHGRARCEAGPLRRCATGPKASRGPATRRGLGAGRTDETLSSERGLKE